MAPKLVNQLILAAFLVVASQCQCAPPDEIILGNDNQAENAAVKDIVDRWNLSIEFNIVSSNLASRYENTTKCYNGTLTLLKQECHGNLDDRRVAPLVLFCRENRIYQLASYWFHLGRLTGASILVPVDFMEQFSAFVHREGLQDHSPQENLQRFGDTRDFGGIVLSHDTYCRRMIQLLREYEKLSFSNEVVIEFFRARTARHVASALELCRVKLGLGSAN